MSRLEEISARLENPETGLEETIQLVEEGLRLVQNGRALLDAAERKIRTLEAPKDDIPVAKRNAPQQIDDHDDGFSLI